MAIGIQFMAETYGFAHIWIWILIIDGHWNSVYAETFGYAHIRIQLQIRKSESELKQFYCLSPDHVENSLYSPYIW